MNVTKHYNNIMKNNDNKKNNLNKITKYIYLVISLVFEM